MVRIQGSVPGTRKEPRREHTEDELRARGGKLGKLSLWVKRC